MLERKSHFESELKNKKDELKTAARRGLVFGQIKDIEFKLSLTDKKKDELVSDKETMEMELKNLNDSNGLFCTTADKFKERDLKNKLSFIEEEINFRKDLPEISLDKKPSQ